MVADHLADARVSIHHNQQILQEPRASLTRAQPRQSIVHVRRRARGAARGRPLPAPPEAVRLAGGQVLCVLQRQGGAAGGRGAFL